MDIYVMLHPLTLNSLCQRGLLKFFRMENMRDHSRLLQTLVRYWDPKQGVFNIHGEILEITMEDIYFIILLSHHGADISLTSLGHGVGALSMQNYVNTYCVPGEQKFTAVRLLLVRSQVSN